MTRDCQGSLCLWHGSEERSFLLIYYKKYFCSEKYEPSAFSLAGCPWRAGYGIIPMPLSVVPSPQQQKDVSHVAPPAHHHACAGRNRSCGPCRLSQRAAVSDVPRCPGDHLSGRGLYRLVPRVGSTGLTPVAARVGDHHAVSGKLGGSSGGGGRPRAHRLEVSAESRLDGSGVRLFGPERVPGPSAGGQCRS